MTIAEALELVDPITEVKPGPLARATLEQYRGRRYASLNVLTVTPEDLCAWCNKNEIPSPRKKYCSEGCSDSAIYYSRPQHPSVKAWILINRQSCACAACGLDYSDELVKRILDRKAFNDRYPTWDGKPLSVTYYYVGVSTGHLWEVDHRIPLHQGGDGIGFENIQVICVACHRRKTALERGRR